LTKSETKNKKRDNKGLCFHVIYLFNKNNTFFEIFIIMFKKNILESIVKNLSKKILTESVVDRVVKDIHRFLVNQFKKQKNDTEYFILYRGGEEVEIKVSLNLEKNRRFNFPFSIDASSEWDELDIEIEYRPQDFPKNMNDLVSELKETVEHEVEHILQAFFDDKHIPSQDYSNNFEYLTTDYEVAAYVKGLITRARHKKITLSQAMDEWFEENKLKFDNPEDEWPKVKRLWLDYANEMRIKNKIKKFQ
jgi:hypothetical protein